MYFYYEDEKQNQDGYILVHSNNEEEVGTKLGLKFNFKKLRF